MSLEALVGVDASSAVTGSAKAINAATAPDRNRTFIAASLIGPFLSALSSRTLGAPSVVAIVRARTGAPC
jgi:hypothetical protein